MEPVSVGEQHYTLTRSIGCDLSLPVCSMSLRLPCTASGCVLWGGMTQALRLLGPSSRIHAFCCSMRRHRCVLLWVADCPHLWHSCPRIAGSTWITNACNVLALPMLTIPLETASLPSAAVKQTLKRVPHRFRVLHKLFRNFRPRVCVSRDHSTRPLIQRQRLKCRKHWKRCRRVCPCRATFWGARLDGL